MLLNLFAMQLHFLLIKIPPLSWIIFIALLSYIELKWNIMLNKFELIDNHLIRLSMKSYGILTFYIKIEIKRNFWRINCTDWIESSNTQTFHNNNNEVKSAAIVCKKVFNCFKSIPSLIVRLRSMRTINAIKIACPFEVSFSS